MCYFLGHSVVVAEMLEASGKWKTSGQQVVVTQCKQGDGIPSVCKKGCMVIVEVSIIHRFQAS